MGDKRYLAISLAAVALFVACASFNGPKGTFTSRDFNAQRPGRIMFEYPIDSTKKPRIDASHIVFDDHQDDQSVAEKASFIVRPPSRARLSHGGIDLEVRDRWMVQRDGSTRFSKVLWVALSNPQITRYPAGGVSGDSTHVDSLVLRATGMTIKVARRATINVGRDTVRVVVLREPLH